VSDNVGTRGDLKEGRHEQVGGLGVQGKDLALGRRCGEV
jgi:hypothetical protein